MKQIIQISLTIYLLVACTNSGKTPENTNSTSITTNDASVTIDEQELDCESLPEHFTSYEEAKELVRDYEFKIEETTNTSSSSWIRSASFFSCDGEYGFFIIDTDYGDYIHKNVPHEVWRKFKNASSFGEFYNKYIKGRYKLEITN